MFDRILQIQNQLKLLYEQLNDLEEAKILAAEEDKARLQQRTDRKLKEIREKEKDYVRELSEEMKRHHLPEEIAELLVDEFASEIELLQSHSGDMRLILQEILQALRKPGISAAAKLKVAIPLVPGIIAFELEGDAERAVRQLFPTFEKLQKLLNKEVTSSGK
jgi:SMC interacting uncharacterized protein involved in chromosome segregation